MTRTIHRVSESAAKTITGYKRGQIPATDSKLRWFQQLQIMLSECSVFVVVVVVVVVVVSVSSLSQKILCLILFR